MDKKRLGDVTPTKEEVILTIVYVGIIVCALALMYWWGGAFR
jgi:hypothetical protein